MENYRGEFNNPEKNGQYEYDRFQGDIDIYWSKSNNANAPTIVHTHGSTAGDEWYASQAAARNRDATFIFPVSKTRTMEDVYENVYREVLEKKGNTENLILTGHSAGGQTTLKELATMYKENKITGEPPLVVMLDGCFDKYGLTEEEIQILADNKVPIVAYYGLKTQRDRYKALGEKGVNIAMIREYDPKENHGTISVSFFDNKNGLYDFVTGKGTLMPGAAGYGISVWSNGEEQYTNGTNLKDISEVDTLDEIYLMMGIYTFEFKINHLKTLNENITTNLSMNNNLFDAGLNQIISKIGNTSYISSNFDNSTTESFSSTISKITDLSNEYFTTTTDLLFNVSKELQEFKKISQAFSLREKQIEQNFVQLNNVASIKPIEFSQYDEPF